MIAESRRRLRTSLAGEGHPPADQPRVASLGDERRSRLTTVRHHGRHLGDVARADDRRRCAAEPTGPVDAVGRHDLGVENDVFRPDDVAEMLEE